MRSDISINVNLNIEKICGSSDSTIVRLFSEDVEEIVSGAEQTYIGTGFASGEDKEKSAARIAIENQFMAMPIKEALRVLIIFTVAIDNEFDEIENAVNMIAETVHPDAKILFGLYSNETMEDEVRVDVIATK
jgi:cell division protein FtsZ